MAQRKPPTRNVPPPNELEQEWEHVDYCVRRMAEDAMDGAQAFAKSNDLSLSVAERKREQRNANRAIEAMLTQIRCFADFLECRGQMSDDMWATDFAAHWTSPAKNRVVTATEWNPGEREVLSQPDFDRISKEVAHLTYKRQRDVEAQKKEWRPEIVLKVLKHAERFFATVGEPLPDEVGQFFEFYTKWLTLNAASFLAGIPSHTAPGLVTHTNSAQPLPSPAPTPEGFTSSSEVLPGLVTTHNVPPNTPYFPSRVR